MIEIKHVTKTFGSKTAVDHIDLNIPPSSTSFSPILSWKTPFR